jgi:hypothetical protein
VTAKKRVPRDPGEYEELIAKATRTGQDGWAEYLAHRFDRDYPDCEDHA